jgi:hypothetical protein
VRVRQVVELAGFQFVWLTCALGAASGWNFPGMIAAGVFVGAQLWLQRSRMAMIGTALASGMAGLAAETAAHVAGLVSYSAHWPSDALAPAWMVALWLAFGSTIPTTAALLGAWPLVKAAALGALFGPLAYAAGARLGALQINDPGWVAFLAIACGWGVIFPALIALARPREADSRERRGCAFQRQTQR